MKLADIIVNFTLVAGVRGRDMNQLFRSRTVVIPITSELYPRNGDTYSTGTDKHCREETLYQNKEFPLALCCLGNLSIIINKTN